MPVDAPPTAASPPPTMVTPGGSLRPFFEPRTVAVVGAGRSRGAIGSEIFHNLLGGFRGRVIPVNPCAGAIEGVRAYPTVSAIEESVDLAVVAVPPTAVESVLDDCIAKAVRAVIVITAGFGETGADGRAREARLRDKVRQAGMRLIGPNCMGLVNTDPAVHLNASFSPVFPPAGPIAFSSQSGALGLAILEYAEQLNLGISSFVSVGNKADVSSNDLLEYWEADVRTKVILLYLESFGNPQRFRDIARRVSATKPIVAVKAGRSCSGARAASSHTGALAASDTVVDALFRESGVIRTETLEELFDVAALLAHQPLPAGNRVAILTNAGGPGILAADACDALGLILPALTPATTAALTAFLPAAASTANPVDMLATASAGDYRRAIPLILADEGIDSLLTIFIPPLVTPSADAARAIAETAGASAKPVLATFFGAAGVPEILAPVPCYTFPESAVRALSHAVQYERWRRAPAGTVPTFDDVDWNSVRAIVESVHRTGGGWMSPLGCAALLDACGIPAAPTRVVLNVAGVTSAARQLGYPVVLKGVGPDILHKTEKHAVYTGLRDEGAVLRAFHALTRRPDVLHVLVQPMVAHGVEMFVGATLDPKFGHTVVCGSGGTLVELLRDTSCRLAPLTDVSARQMLDDIRGVALLRGFRGAPPLAESALLEVLLRLSALLDACPDIVEVDFNPVIVTTTGAACVDARIRVDAPAGERTQPRTRGEQGLELYMMVEIPSNVIFSTRSPPISMVLRTTGLILDADQAAKATREPELC
jgi:acetyl coenzyme A synthetase (ADP forming)-like protein